MRTAPPTSTFLESFAGLLDEVVAGGPPPAESPNGPLYDPQSDASMLEWAQRELPPLRLNGLPKLRAVFLTALHAFQQGVDLQLAMLGPRTGGKTLLSAAIEVMAWRWFGGDWTNVGGSEQQARECYGYIRKWISGSEDLRRFTFVTQRSLTTSKQGGKIIVCTASERSVRGPHPHGPSGLGGVSTDEEAVMEQRIQEATVDQLGAAKPKATIRSSTLGQVSGVLGASWRKLVADPKKQGFDLHQWTAFDVAAGCKYECTKEGGAAVGGCPVKEHFADDYYEGQGEHREFVHAGYCKGVAHGAEGWHSIDFLASRWSQMDREGFEREYVGMGAAARAGKVYDPALIDAAIVRDDVSFGADEQQHVRRLRGMRKKRVGLDWGFSGQTAIAYGVQVRMYDERDVLLVYRWDLYTETRFSLIRDEVVDHCFAERIQEVWPDGANPSDNAELEAVCERRARAEAEKPGAREEDVHNFAVRPVIFSRTKAFGLGEVRRRLEKGLLKFATSFGGKPVRHWERAIEYLKGYAKDDNGNPIKKDDHVADATLMLAVSFAEGVPDLLPGR